MDRHHAAIAERAGQQLGLITISDTRELGLTEHQRRHLVATGVLIRLSRPVFRHAGWPQTDEQRLLAAAWTVGKGAAVSHMSAAWLWQLDGVGAGAVEVAVAVSRCPVLHFGLVHRTRHLSAADTTAIGLIPVTTPERTLIDLAPRLELHQLEEALDGACRRNQIYLPRLEWRLAELRRPGWTGAPKLDALLTHGRRDRKEETWLESAYLRILQRAGLPLPRLQVTVTPGGGPRYRLDGIYDDHDLVVEIDGHATHATRRRRQADAERHMRLQTEGKRLLRFTYEDVVERPHYVACTTARFLGISLSPEVVASLTPAA
ncbi:MAG: DUF559 domain-containing protein [Acidimicrobiales bacterium]